MIPTDESACCVFARIWTAWYLSHWLKCQFDSYSNNLWYQNNIRQNIHNILGNEDSLRTIRRLSWYRTKWQNRIRLVRCGDLVKWLDWELSSHQEGGPFLCGQSKALNIFGQWCKKECLIVQSKPIITNTPSTHLHDNNNHGCEPVITSKHLASLCFPLYFIEFALEYFITIYLNTLFLNHGCCCSQEKEAWRGRWLVLRQLRNCRGNISYYHRGIIIISYHFADK